MVDFKKELLKYQPVRTADDELLNGIISGEITDMSEVLKMLIASVTKNQRPDGRG